MFGFLVNLLGQTTVNLLIARIVKDTVVMPVAKNLYFEPRINEAEDSKFSKALENLKLNDIHKK